MNSSNVRDFSRANSDQQITALLPFEAFAISKANRPLNFQMGGELLINTALKKAACLIPAGRDLFLI